MKLRYATQNCCASDIKRLANELRSTVSGNRIGLLTAYSKDDSESTQLFKAIKEVVNDSSYDVVIVDTSLSPLGKDLYDRYIDAMANAQYQRNKDNQQANQYENSPAKPSRNGATRLAMASLSYILTTSLTVSAYLT